MKCICFVFFSECDCESGHCDMHTGECLAEATVNLCNNSEWSKQQQSYRVRNKRLNIFNPGFTSWFQVVTSVSGS